MNSVHYMYCWFKLWLFSSCCWPSGWCCDALQNLLALWREVQCYAL